MKPIFYARHFLDNSDIEEVKSVLRGNWLTQGPIVSELESRVAEFCRVRYGVAVNSGTSALHLATFAAGIKKGDEVITTPLSFAASANCILYQGGTPVFADVDYETGLLDPKEVKKKITSRTKAVISVDYAGHPSYFLELKRLCRHHNLVLIADSCHSLGAVYRNKIVGSQADITVLSFHPAKVITTGEGGMILTNNKKFYEKALLLRSHGITSKSKDLIRKSNKNIPWYYEMQELGYNYRISDLQCALGVSQLKKIKKFLKLRRDIASYYNRALKDNSRFKVPLEIKGSKSAWHLYPLRIVDRKINKEALFKKFNDQGIFPQVHFIPIHTHPYYQKRFGYNGGDFPRAEKFYEEEISLPLYPSLSKSDLRRVTGVLEDL